MGVLKEKEFVDEVLAQEDIVKLFHVEKATALKFMANNLNGFRVGRRWLVLRSEVDKFLKEQVKKAKESKKK